MITDPDSDPLVSRCMSFGEAFEVCGLVADNSTGEIKLFLEKQTFAQSSLHNSSAGRLAT